MATLRKRPQINDVRNSAQSPLSGGAFAEFRPTRLALLDLAAHGITRRRFSVSSADSLSDRPLVRQARDSDRSPHAGGEFDELRRICVGDPGPSHSPKNRPGGASADNRIPGRAGNTDAGRERTSETTATEKTSGRRTKKELKLTKPPHRKTNIERYQKP